MDVVGWSGFRTEKIEAACIKLKLPEKAYKRSRFLVWSTSISAEKA
jgi:hypothetical protein